MKILHPINLICKPVNYINCKQILQFDISYPELKKLLAEVFGIKIPKTIYFR